MSSRRLRERTTNSERFEKQSLETVESALAARSLKAEIDASRRSHSGSRHLSRTLVRCETRTRRYDHTRLFAGLSSLSRQDVQADARPFEDDGYNFKNTGRL